MSFCNLFFFVLDFLLASRSHKRHENTDTALANFIGLNSDNTFVLSFCGVCDTQKNVFIVLRLFRS